MNLLQSIYSAKPLRCLKWFDILIITVLMFGEFIAFNSYYRRRNYDKSSK